MSDLTENLTIRCSPADLEAMDRLRLDRSRGALLRTLLRRAARESVGIAATARDAGIDAENADLFAALAVRRGLRQVEEDSE